MSKVTRIAHSKNLNQGKYAQLQDIAQRLGLLRAQFWRDYGSLRGVGLHYGVVAKEQEGGNEPLSLTYKLWKNTLKDIIEDIGTYRAAAKQKSDKRFGGNIPCRRRKANQTFMSRFARNCLLR